MKSIIKKVGTALLFVPMLALSVGFFAPAAHADCEPGQGLTGAINADCASGEGQQTGSLFGNGSIVNNVINIMLFIVGILCVVMIVYGGIRYTISRGDKGEVEGAKNTIMYAIIGLIVAIVAYALVNWVFTSIGQS
jgi:hypothetical protein